MITPLTTFWSVDLECLLTYPASVEAMGRRTCNAEHVALKDDQLEHQQGLLGAGTQEQSSVDVQTQMNAKVSQTISTLDWVHWH